MLLRSLVPAAGDRNGLRSVSRAIRRSSRSPLSRGGSARPSSWLTIFRKRRAAVHCVATSWVMIVPFHRCALRTRICAAFTEPRKSHIRSLKCVSLRLASYCSRTSPPAGFASR
jgi:hypothetical protein